MDPALNEDPGPIYAQMREHRLLFWPGVNFYVVPRLADALAVLQDPRLSTDTRAAGLPAPESMLPDALRAPIEASLTRLAPKDHARVRRAVASAFTPGAIKGMRAKVQAIVDEAIDLYVHDGVLEARAFVEHIPLRVIAAMLGIPVEQQPSFYEFANNLAKLHNPAMTPEQFASVAPVVIAGLERIRALVAARREALGDDLLSVVIRAEANGDALSSDEMLGLVAMLINGGILTTTHFMMFTFKSLLCVPERAAAVRRDRSLVGTALEEVLRHDSFGKSGTLRYLTQDAEVAGVSLPRGAAVMVFFPAAYLDEDAFPSASSFDPARKPDKNLNYGHGPHFCTGAALARLEGDVLVNTLLDRFASFTLIGEPVFAPDPMVRDIVQMRVEVTRELGAESVWPVEEAGRADRWRPKSRSASRMR
ncbi:putative cytochrome P450 hydroxylase [Enhygromyxa salina]|uniref:Putative cytochrome P450 hydroxylase n=2 Tax=Enhygromyxa salina TaxID=215803 RepID=A0A0C2CQ27_9BACT|nr:putative cytochrome P450 hydroxylase [Enhygromyxa salina]